MLFFEIDHQFIDVYCLKLSDQLNNVFDKIWYYIHVTGVGLHVLRQQSMAIIDKLLDQSSTAGNKGLIQLISSDYKVSNPDYCIDFDLPQLPWHWSPQLSWHWSLGFPAPLSLCVDSACASLVPKAMQSRTRGLRQRGGWRGVVKGLGLHWQTHQRNQFLKTTVSSE